MCVFFCVLSGPNGPVYARDGVNGHRQLTQVPKKTMATLYRPSSIYSISTLFFFFINYIGFKKKGKKKKKETKAKEKNPHKRYYCWPATSNSIA
jgi:hypothetical protein